MQSPTNHTNINNFQSEHRGKNIVINAVFMRHGETEWNEKINDHILSPEGIKQTLESSSIIPNGEIMRVFSSPKPRAEKTANLLNHFSKTENKINYSVDNELLFNYDPDGEFARNIAKIGQDLARKNLSENEISNAQTNFYLNFAKERPDPNTYSPYETASALASRIQIFIDIAPKLLNESNITLLNISHDYSLASILKFILILPQNKQAGFDKIEKIGGAIDHNEFFILKISTDQDKKMKVKLFLRNQNYSIDLVALEELSDHFYQNMQEIDLNHDQNRLDENKIRV